MANKTPDTAAAKAKKQKIVLATGAVLLLGLAAIQGPKLMNGGGGEDAVPAPVSAAAAPGAGATASAATLSVASAQVVSGKNVAVVSGVRLAAAPATTVGKSQLASFVLFDSKDPFVPGVDEAAGDPAAPTGSQAQPASGAAPQSSPAAGPAPAAPAPVAYATITVDGKPQQLELKDTFPDPGPVFVLRSLSKKQAKIGVAGGSFDDGQAVTLQLGKKVTLLNTATGERYVLRLVYTGAAPEVIEGFTTKSKATGSSAAGAAKSATVQVTPTP
jgi:hypothetical protein